MVFPQVASRFPLTSTCLKRVPTVRNSDALLWSSGVDDRPGEKTEEVKQRKTAEEIFVKSLLWIWRNTFLVSVEHSVLWAARLLARVISVFCVFACNACTYQFFKRSFCRRRGLYACKLRDDTVTVKWWLNSIKSASLLILNLWKVILGWFSFYCIFVDSFIYFMECCSDRLFFFSFLLLCVERRRTHAQDKRWRAGHRHISIVSMRESAATVGLMVARCQSGGSIRTFFWYLKMNSTGVENELK